MLIVESNGRTFTYAATEAHIRLDDTVTRLHRWQVKCLNPACQKVLDIKTPALDVEGVEHPPEDPGRQASLAYARRYCCRAHHARPTQKRKTLPTSYASRRRLTDADVAALRALAADIEPHCPTRGVLYEVLSVAVPFTPGTIREILSGRRRPAP
jgi:hypothetical protein